MVDEEKAKSLACYALALLHGVPLADFEVEHVKTLAEEFGAAVTLEMRSHLEKLGVIEELRTEKIRRLEHTIEELKRARLPWWKRIF